MPAWSRQGSMESVAPTIMHSLSPSIELLKSPSIEMLTGPVPGTPSVWNDAQSRSFVYGSLPSPRSLPETFVHEAEPSATLAHVEKVLSIPTPPNESKPDPHAETMQNTAHESKHGGQEEEQTTPGLNQKPQPEVKEPSGEQATPGHNLKPQPEVKEPSGEQATPGLNQKPQPEVKEPSGEQATPGLNQKPQPEKTDEAKETPNQATPGLTQESQPEQTKLDDEGGEKAEPAETESAQLEDIPKALAEAPGKPRPVAQPGASAPDPKDQPKQTAKAKAKAKANAKSMYADGSYWRTLS